MGDAKARVGVFAIQRVSFCEISMIWFVADRDDRGPRICIGRE